MREIASLFPASAVAICILKMARLNGSHHESLQLYTVPRPSHYRHKYVFTKNGERLQLKKAEHVQ